MGFFPQPTRYRDASPPPADEPQMEHDASPSANGSSPGSCLSQAPPRLLCSSPPALISTAVLLPSSPVAQPIGMDVSAHPSQQHNHGDPSAGTTAAMPQPPQAADKHAPTADYSAGVAGGEQTPRRALSVPSANHDDASAGGGRNHRPAIGPHSVRSGAAARMPQVPLPQSAPAGVTSCDTSKGSSDTPTARDGRRAWHRVEPDTPDTPSGETTCVLQTRRFGPPC